MNLPKNWKRRALETAAIFLLLSAVAWAISTTYHMTAPVEQKQLTLYADVGLTTQITPTFDWAGRIQPLTNGTAITIWLKNTGNTDLTAALVIQNPVGCSIALSAASIPLTPGQNATTMLTFTGLTGSTADWDLKVDY